jgi:hypothetical protein
MYCLAPPRAISCSVFYNLINVLKQTHMMSMLALLGLSLASLHGFLSGSSLPAHGYCKSSMASASLVVETFRRTTHDSKLIMAPGPYDNDPACVCARCLQRAVQRHRLCLLCLLAQVDDMITGAATDVLRPVTVVRATPSSPQACMLIVLSRPRISHLV